jgi:tRNA threonylcarbamoyladenosine biosynthesis protein TsaE
VGQINRATEKSISEGRLQLPFLAELKTERETGELARRFARLLAGGDLVMLSGTLGAGKTLFVRAAASVLGVDEDEISSPSFALVNRYEGEELTVYHIDLWRLDEGSIEIDTSLSLSEILDDEKAIVFIEWAEKLKKLPETSKIYEVNISGDGEQARVINIRRLR